MRMEARASRFQSGSVVQKLLSTTILSLERARCYQPQSPVLPGIRPASGVISVNAERPESMTRQFRSFPFRWVLPSLQLLACFVVLWPVRNRLLVEAVQSIHSYAPAKARSERLQDSERVYILPSLTPEQQQELDARVKFAELRMKVPLLLNFPVLVAQLPYILLNPAKREWIPKGMFPATWRALSWPFAGLVFWWFSGRGIEALRAACRAVVHPRVGRMEATLAAVLFCFGLVALIGILTSTPDDRKNVQFLTLVAGAVLWGCLATVTIVARFLQWRIPKRRVTPETPAGHLPG